MVKAGAFILVLVYGPEIEMQEFENFESCNAAIEQLKESATGSKPFATRNMLTAMTGICIPKDVTK